MARAESYSVAELEQMLEAARKNEVKRLTDRRDQLVAELTELERQIDGFGGGGGRGRLIRRRRPGGRSRNQPSLKKVILEVLQKSKKPLSTDEILERVQATGYKSNSDEFRKVLYLNLFNLKKSGEINHDRSTKVYSAAS